MTSTVNAYMAGLLDGEGYITIRKNGKYHPSVAVRITSTTRNMLNWVQSQFQGAIGKHPLPPNPNWKRAWYWQCGRVAAIAMLQQVLPFLIVKKRQAEIAINYSQLLTPRCRPNAALSGLRSCLLQEMTARNKRGPSEEFKSMKELQS